VKGNCPHHYAKRAREKSFSKIVCNQVGCVGWNTEGVTGLTVTPPLWVASRLSRFTQHILMNITTRSIPMKIAQTSQARGSLPVQSRFNENAAKQMSRILVIGILLGVQTASALIVQPYLNENKLSFYAGMFPEKTPVHEINLTPDIAAAWPVPGTGPNAVVCRDNKIFVSFDINYSYGGVFVYNAADLYPVRNGNAPLHVLRPGGGLGRSCIGMAIHPTTGDLYVGTFGGGVFIYTAVSGYSPASETLFVGMGDVGGRVKSVCANLAFDYLGNLWLSTWRYTDTSNPLVGKLPADHLLICFKNGNAGTAYSIRNAANEAYMASIRTGGTTPVHFLSAPEGIAFDMGRHVWVANNNDNTRTNEYGEGTVCKISSSWVYNTMLAGNPGDYEVPTNQSEVKLIPGGLPGGLHYGVIQGLLINDQGSAKTVWRYNTANSAFNEQTCYTTGIPATYPGNGSMGIFNENSVLTQPPVTDLAYSMTTTGSYIRGATASFRITITNVGTHAIPVGMSQYCGCQTVFGPSPPNPISVTPVSFSGTGWFGTVIDGIPVARHYGGLAPGQSYPPLTFTFDIADNVNATSVFVAAEGYGPNEIEIGDNLTWQSAATVPPNVIERFRIDNFGDAHPVGDAADDAAPAGDGIPNLMKFALDLDPNEPAVLQERVDDVLEGGQLAFDIVRNPAAVGAGLVYVVEQTTNLADPNSWTSNGVTVNIDTPSRLKATLNQPVFSGAAFMRLKVLVP